MKAAVCGIGRMGQAICHAMHNFGFEVIGIDSNPAASKSFEKQTNNFRSRFYLTNENKTWEEVLSLEKPDIVISSLPYHQTEEVALWCIDNQIRYCDLGGRVDVSHRINDYAEKHAKKPVMTDLGVAPGWVNILAEQGCKEMHRVPDSVKMMVGGLPAEPINPPLDYIVTWSIDGLINEYRDTCETIKDGSIIQVDGMEGREEIYVKVLDKKLEAFYTSGGASHTIQSMSNRGVKNCSYKTLRYLGHGQAVKFLIRDCNLTDDCLLQIFEKGCIDKNNTGDIVVIKVMLKGGNLDWNKEILIKSNKNFSAMQQATAFPISSVASLMAEGFFDGNKDEHRDYYTQYSKNLSYGDILFNEFNKKLEILGIDL